MIIEHHQKSVPSPHVTSEVEKDRCGAGTSCEVEEEEGPARCIGLGIGA